MKVLKYKDRSILRFLSSSYTSSNNTLITKTFRRIMKMTRAQDGGGNREEVLESWSLGTLSEHPQPSVHAARVPSRSARVLLRLCFHRTQTSRFVSIASVTQKRVSAQSLVSFSFYPQCAQCPVKSPISFQNTRRGTPLSRQPIVSKSSRSTWRFAGHCTAWQGLPVFIRSCVSTVVTSFLPPNQTDELQ